MAFITHRKLYITYQLTLRELFPNNNKKVDPT